MSNLPRILLADEPTANLDLATGKSILNTLRRINKTRCVTVICSTHDHRLLTMCDRIMWIRDGRVERVERRDDLTITVGTIGGEE